MQQHLPNTPQTTLNPATALLRRPGLNAIDRDLAELPRSCGDHGDELNRGVILVAKDGKRVVGAAWARNRIARQGRTLFLSGPTRQSPSPTITVTCASAQRCLRRSSSELPTPASRCSTAICTEDGVPFHKHAGLTATGPGHSIIPEVVPDLQVPLTAENDHYFVNAELVPPGPERRIALAVVEANRAAVYRAFGVPAPVAS